MRNGLHFQNDVTESYLAAAAVDKLCILARIDAIKEYNKTSPDKISTELDWRRV